MLKVFMRVWPAFLSLSCVLVSLFAFSQGSPSSAVAPGSASASGEAATQKTEALPSRSLADVMDRVIEREHLFLAQMRHMHPMVETYIQDLKTDRAGDTRPA
jgi:hypothetical protein